MMKSSPPMWRAPWTGWTPWTTAGTCSSSSPESVKYVKWRKRLEGRNLRNTRILPLFARLGLGDQQRIFHPERGCRRIVLATNVAETSLTIPGIIYVIDSGLARVSRYSPARQVQRLQIEPVSKASARQRAGRCGRVCEGRLHPPVQ